MPLPHCSSYLKTSTSSLKGCAKTIWCLWAFEVTLRNFCSSYDQAEAGRLKPPVITGWTRLFRCRTKENTVGLGVRPKSFNSNVATVATIGYGGSAS